MRRAKLGFVLTVVLAGGGCTEQLGGDSETKTATELGGTAQPGTEPNDSLDPTEALEQDDSESLTAVPMDVEAARTPRLPVARTRRATSLGTDAFSANGRIRARGKPTTYHFEYGTTTSYGSSTPTRSLAPKLTAVYRETWDEGRGNWSAGMSFEDLEWNKSGGMSRGFVRSYDRQGAADDTNHIDGIGIVHLSKFMYPGSASEELPTAALGAGDPDLRDARISISVRGRKFVPNGTELTFWMQCDRDLEKQNEPDWRRANWAHTGFTLTDALKSGTWESLTYRLNNDTTQWTYAGNSVYQERDNYVYWTLDSALAHVSTDIFHMLVFVDQAAEPLGAIDYDEMTIEYRNHNVLIPSNGGRLVSAPEAPDDAGYLTDGWRNGADHSWRGPAAPSEIVYQLAKPVTVERVQVHQHIDYPTKDVEVLVSTDGKRWWSIATGEIPRVSTAGKNFSHFLARGLSAKARFVKVRTLSGYSRTAWGLGEIEIFGTGALEGTDDDVYNVNADITGLSPGTYHYRVVAETEDGAAFGQDRSFVVSDGAKPETVTLPAIRIERGTADLQARVNPFGNETETYFQYGPTKRYGMETVPKWAGVQITPRPVHEKIEDLVPGTEMHYRIVTVGPWGKRFGRDRTFIAQ